MNGTYVFRKWNGSFKNGTCDKEFLVVELFHGCEF